jgi:hypothetical protein
MDAVCQIDSCERRNHRAGLCRTHYDRKRAGNTLQTIRNYKDAGGRYVRKTGYIFLYLPKHPQADSAGLVSEHRLAMEEYLGRCLVPGESIHHKNGNRGDNRIANLELWSHSQPSGQRAKDKVKWAIEILQLYAPQLLLENPRQKTSIIKRSTPEPSRARNLRIRNGKVSS